MMTSKEYIPAAKQLRKFGLGWRHVVALLGFIGFFNNYTLRVNLSVALVAMVNQTSLSNNALTNVTQCTNGGSHFGNTTGADIHAHGQFNWNEKTQGLILGAFFYGYISTQIPAGIIASRYGGKWLLGLGILGASVLTLLVPVAAQTSTGLLIAIRVLVGVTEGVTWPAMHSILSKWVPPMERTFLSAIAYTGCNFGIVVAFTSAGYLCDSVWGWPSVFCVYGIVGCVWSVLWFLLLTNSPETHPWISEEEKEYIERSNEGEGVHAAGFRQMPWKSILKSGPVWAICVSHFCENWGFYTLLTMLPTYFNNVLGFNIKANGVVSSMPYLVLLFTQTFFGYLADVLRTRFKMKTVHARKLYDCTGHVLAGVGLVLVGYVGCNGALAVALLTCSAGISGLNHNGYLINHLDIAPKFAGLLFGISNTVATIPGFVSPYIAGMILNDNAQDAGAWRTVFLITVGVYLFSAAFYFVFAAGNVQHWARDTESTVNHMQKIGYIVDAAEMDQLLDEDKIKKLDEL